MRQTIKEIETNVAYRWFLGFGFYTEVPHFSTFGKNYERRFKETDDLNNLLPYFKGDFRSRLIESRTCIY